MVEADIDSQVPLRLPLRILEVPAIRPPWVQLRLRRRDPSGLARGPPARCLCWRQDHVAHAGPDQELQGRGIHGRLGQPHGLGVPAEAVSELADAPVDLGPTVARRRQRKDHVIVRQGQGIAMAPAGAAAPIGVEEGFDDVRRLPGHPGKECGPDVEADPFVVVDDVLDAPAPIQHAGTRVGRVALGHDPRVPVVERRGALLPFDLPGPGVLAGRLVEVTVDYQMNRHVIVDCGLKIADWDSIENRQSPITNPSPCV